VCISFPLIHIYDIFGGQPGGRGGRMVLHGYGLGWKGKATSGSGSFRVLSGWDTRMLLALKICPFTQKS
jgi:hypothetical protein